MTTGPQDPAAAADRDRLRAGHADREDAIEALKDAFVAGRLVKDEFDARVAQALAPRTYADLAALTTDIPPAPAAARPGRPPAPARRWPLAKAAAGSGGCLAIAYAAAKAVGLADPGVGPGPIPKFLGVPLFLLFLAAVITALTILGRGVAASVHQRRSRRRLPPRPGPGGHALTSQPHRGPGNRPAPPRPPTGQAKAGLQAPKPPQHRQRIPARAGRAPGGVRPAPGAV